VATLIMVPISPKGRVQGLQARSYPASTAGLILRRLVERDWAIRDGIAYFASCAGSTAYTAYLI
jgi:hypothetical protein